MNKNIHQETLVLPDYLNIELGDQYVPQYLFPQTTAS
jgi:hypothetical protein